MELCKILSPIIQKYRIGLYSIVETQQLDPSNAQVERISSQQNLIKNKSRNKMNIIDTLSNHLVIDQK